MKKVLILFLLLCSSLVYSQNPVYNSVRFSGSDSTSYALPAGVGNIRYDAVTGKYRFWNNVTDTWFSYSTGGGNFSGTYTPTLTDVTNVESSTAFVCQFMRVGNVVTVSGEVVIDPTLLSTTTELAISLPIASNFASANQCGGTAATPNVAGQSASIAANITLNEAFVAFISGSTNSAAFWFSFTYLIL